MRNPITAALILAAAAAAATATAQEPYSEEIAAVKALIERQLKDPASAQYRDVRAFDQTGTVMVCGDVNAKNSYGGYTGFEGFVFWNDKLTFPGGNNDIVSMHQRKFVKLLCDGKPAKTTTEAESSSAPQPGQ